MIIRDAVEPDLPAIVEIYNSAIRTRVSTAQLELVSVADRRQWFEQHSFSHPLWVAEEVHGIAGWLSFHPFLPRGAYRGTAEISLYIGETFQRQGIGRAMVEKAITYSPTLHLHTLIAGIFGHNEPSLRFFEQLGFVRWGHLPHIARVDGVARDLVIVGRHIEKS
jgi:L-amino acid N-acyltransferase YncA